MDLTARPYRCFVAVAEAKSFRRAANRLHISQPALSAQIRELERQLGFALFTRTKRTVSITSEGHLLLNAARRYIDETDLLQRTADEIRINDLRIGSPLFTALIENRNCLIDSFAQENPAVALRILNDDHQVCLDKLSHGDTDLVISIVSGSISGEMSSSALFRATGIPPSMEHLVLKTRPVELLVPREHPLASLEEIPIDKIAGLPIIRLGQVHGRVLSHSIERRLISLNADVIHGTEGNAISVEREARRLRRSAVTLGWSGGNDPDDMARRKVSGWDLFTSLVLIRNRVTPRPSCQTFWEMASRFIET